MSLEEAARTELLRMRKHRDGVTVAALSRTNAIRQVLGGGDPRMAYNALKHILLEHSADLGVTAASYSLGYASDGVTHLDRLTEFGLDHGYDQRQARRYSDRGIVAVARSIGSEWTLEASPVLRLAVVRWDDEQGLEALIRTERLPFIEMQLPRVELIDARGVRTTVDCEWEEQTWTDGCRSSGQMHIPVDGIDSHQLALSILWPGELWPKFEVSWSGDKSPPKASGDLRVEALAARVQLSIV
jgi:hypothetical protein